MSSRDGHDGTQFLSALSQLAVHRNINGIKKWIRVELSKTDPDTDRMFDSNGEIDLAEFTPQYFEKFLVYKRRSAKSGTLSGYRSAIKDLYRLKRIPLPTEYGDDLKQLFLCIKRLEEDQNQSSSPKTPGKQPLTYSRYKELCNPHCCGMIVCVSSNASNAPPAGER